ncbi:MAG: barstar family protein [Bacteroidaceae bacterium]|nr:barstar family protein [Bacteroidaceae bacterium]
MKNKFIWNTKDETAYMEDSFVMPNLALILEMKQEGNSLFIYSMSYDNKYFYIKVIDAHIFLDLVDMTKNINVYKSVDDIKDFQQKDVFVAKIASVNHKEELLSELKTHVHIPPHITCNWDAMPKLLYEPFWIGKPLVIVHDDISNLPKSDMEIYKNVITYCKLHTLHTFFVFNDRDYFSIMN